MTPALATLVEALEAERLAPVPRDSHTVGVDVDDLALVLDHAQTAASMPGEVAVAFQHLGDVIRGHVMRGAL